MAEGGRWNRATSRPWLTPGRFQSHEVFLLAWSVFIGVSGLLGAPKSNSMVTQLDQPVLTMWAVSMVVAGVVGLIGCYWPHRFDVGLELERGALLIQSGGLTLFAAAIFVNVGWIGLTVGGIALAWTIADLARVWRITRALRYARRTLPQEDRERNEARADDDETDRQTAADQAGYAQEADVAARQTVVDEQVDAKSAEVRKAEIESGEWP